MIKRAMNKLFNLINFLFHLTMGKLRGVPYIIRYLRNPDPNISVKLLRAFGAKIGHGTIIKRTIYLDNVCEDQNSTDDFSHLEIGDNCYIGDLSYFDLANKIDIGSNVVIAGQVSFITHADCNRSKYLNKLLPRTCKEIIVEDGVWIAFKCTVLNGVTIGENSVIAACSLVKNDIDSCSIYVGVPAKKIKDIS